MTRFSWAEPDLSSRFKMPITYSALLSDYEVGDIYVSENSSSVCTCTISFKKVHFARWIPRRPSSHTQLLLPVGKFHRQLKRPISSPNSKALAVILPGNFISLERLTERKSKEYTYVVEKNLFGINTAKRRILVF